MQAGETVAIFNKARASEWLREAADYFETRKTHGEDKAYWANVYNAKNARDIADFLDAS